MQGPPHRPARFSCEENDGPAPEPLTHSEVCFSRFFQAACLFGASAAVSLQRYVIIVGTSFGGAWTALVGARALGGHTESVAAAGGDPWQLYPMVPANGQVGFAIGWFGFGLLAALVQLRWSSPMRRRKRRSSEDDK